MRVFAKTEVLSSGREELLYRFRQKMILMRCGAWSFLGWKPAIVQVLGGGFWNLGVPIFFSKLVAKWLWPGSGRVESGGLAVSSVSGQEGVGREVFST